MLKYVNDWNLSKESKAIVKRELRKWRNEFIKRASGHIGSVEKCDWIRDELFFFTNCKDLMGGEPESKAVEDKKSIRNRKHNVMLSLFVRQLLGDKIKIAQKKCSHCGFEPMDIEGAGEGGYYRHCPKCDRLVIDTFVKWLFPTAYNIHEDFKDDEEEESVQ